MQSFRLLRAHHRQVRKAPAPQYDMLYNWQTLPVLHPPNSININHILYVVKSKVLFLVRRLTNSAILRLYAGILLLLPKWDYPGSI